MLAVVGSGEYLPAMAAVDRQLLGLLGPAPRVVCRPTAAGREGDKKIDDWMHRGVDHFTSLGAEAEPVRVWDRASANDPAIPSAVVSAMRRTVGKNHTLVGVNANTALVNDGSSYQVVGEQVTVWTSTDKTAYGPGPLPAAALDS
jgi:hypothetical protein